MGGYCGYEAKWDIVTKGVVGWMQNKAGCCQFVRLHTWRINPVSEWFPCISHGKAICEGGITLLRGLAITMAIDHLPTGMFLQVPNV